jgi:hypothetical protein
LQFFFVFLAHDDRYVFRDVTCWKIVAHPLLSFVAAHELWRFKDG